MRTTGSPRRWTRGLAVACCVLGSTAALSACGGSNKDGGGGSPAAAGTSTQAASTKPVTLTFLACCSADQMKTLIKDFQVKYPNITVKQEIVPFENLNDVVQSRLSQKDSSFDVYDADQPRTAALAARGFLMNLSETPYGALAKRNLFPQSVVASSYQGQIFSAPMWSSSQVLYYNKALLKKAGVTPPSQDPEQRWTWEQLYDAAQKTRKAGSQCGFMFDQPDRYYQLQPLVESAGGGSGLSGADLRTPDVTNAGWVKAMDFYSKLYASKVSPRGVPAEQSRALFATGKCAFFLGVPAIPDFNGPKAPSYGFAPHPYFQGGKPATPSDSFALGVNPNTKNKDAVLKFVEYATTDVDGNLASVADNPNPTPNVKALPQFFATVEKGQPQLTGLGDLVDYELQHTVVHRPPSTGYITFESTIGNAFADIRNGQPVQAALDKAQKELGSELAR
jgi:multiple sugar transport system substrate-binding protein